MVITERIKHFIKGRFDQWLSVRMPPTLTRTLNNRSIFIFPTRLGFAYLLVTILVFLLGTNYQNNVIILLAYLLSSLFITVMLQSYYNFKGLTISAAAEVVGYAKHHLDIPYTIASNKTKHGLTLMFAGQPKTIVQKLDKETLVHVKYFAQQRGVTKLERLNISSEYSLGLFKTWTWCDFGTQAVIYPEIKSLPTRWLNTNSHLKQHAVQDSGSAFTSGIDDFHELNGYREGEPLTHVAWKQLARGQGKYTKTYRQPVSTDTWLILNQMPGQDIEQKLSYLCYLVVQYMPQDVNFGLDLNNREIPPNSGQVHAQNCLKALATYHDVGA